MDALVDELGIRDRCLFLGNRSDVADLYRACDVTLLPSLFEGTPNVVLESLASGVPVVATDVADNRLLLPEGEVGHVVPARGCGRPGRAAPRPAGRRRGPAARRRFRPGLGGARVLDDGARREDRRHLSGAPRAAVRPHLSVV